MAEVTNLQNARAQRLEQHVERLLRYHTQWQAGIRAGWSVLQDALPSMGNPVQLTENAYAFPVYCTEADCLLGTRTVRSAVAVHVTGRLFGEDRAAHDTAQRALEQLTRDTEAGVAQLPGTRGRLLQVVATATTGYTVELQHEAAPCPSDYDIPAPESDAVTPGNFAAMLTEGYTPEQIIGLMSANAEAQLRPMYEVIGLLTTAGPHRVG